MCNEKCLLSSQKRRPSSSQEEQVIYMKRNHYFPFPLIPPTSSVPIRRLHEMFCLWQVCRATLRDQGIWSYPKSRCLPTSVRRQANEAAADQRYETTLVLFDKTKFVVQQPGREQDRERKSQCLHLLWSPLPFLPRILLKL